MSADQEKYRDTNLDLSSDKYDKNNDDYLASYNQNKQDDLQNTTSLSQISAKKKRDSTVWLYFNENTGSPVCKEYKASFSTTIVNPHSQIEQHERDDLVIRWIICDLQPFNVVEGKEWRAIVSKFDPRYQFPSRNMIRDYVTELFQQKKDEVKLALHKISTHVLNLAVGSGLDFIDKSIVKVRLLMSYIKASQPTINNLKKLCEIKSVEYLAPELD
ncbi:22892_t:CDS:2, partial [Gigaspora margarita]